MYNKFKFSVQRQNTETAIIVGKSLLEEINTLIDLKSFSSFLIICDQRVLPSAEKAERQLKITGKKTGIFILNGGEKVKSISSLKRIYQKLFTFKADRKTLVISLGGGTIGDVVGFAAATYLRGLSFIQIPTTLLAMVDASLGGKTAVNFNRIKNLIGAFHQPKAVLIDLHFLKTLPKNEMRNGMAEIIKYGLTLDKSLINILLEYKKNKNKLLEIIKRSVLLKMKIVSRDEQEGNQRAILNFGHTIGHAIEANSKNFGHGEAVAIGMAGATLISQRMGFIAEPDVNKILNLLRDFSLPIKVRGITPTELIEAMKKDKKKENKEINWVLLKQIGQGIIKQKVDKKIIKQVLEKLCN